MITAARYASSSTHPVLSNIMIRDGQVTGSNLELTYQETLTIDGFPECCIPAESVKSILSTTSTNWQVNRTGERILLTSGRSRYTLPALDVDQYPALETPSGKTTILDLGDELRGALSCALSCAGLKDHRFFLNGVHLVLNGTRYTATGTDGHRMFTSTGNASVRAGNGLGLADTDFEVILSRNFVEEMLKLPVTAMHFITDAGGQAASEAHGDGFVLRARCVQAQYPSISSALNKQNNQYINLSAKQWSSAVSRMRFATNKTFRMVTVTAHPDGVQLITGDGDTQAEEWLDADTNGITWRNNYNIDYLSGILKTIGAGDLRLYPSLDDHSGTFFETGEWIFLLMPMQA